MCSKRCCARIRRLEVARRIDRFLISFMALAITLMIMVVGRGHLTRGDGLILFVVMVASLASLLSSIGELVDELWRYHERKRQRSQAAAQPVARID